MGEENKKMAQSIQEFLEEQQRTVTYLRNLSPSRVTIVHHNDTDGICSGAILKEALRREGYTPENIPIERVHPLFLPKIHTEDRELILYADLGSQALLQIAGAMRKQHQVMIFDHHPPLLPSERQFQRHLYLVNPERFGIEGDLQSSAAAVAFFFARALSTANDDLACLSILGAIGDRQLSDGSFVGLNRMAFEIALRQGQIRCDYGAEADGALPRFDGRRGKDISQVIVDLAVNGFYEGGAIHALEFCLKGPSPETDRFSRRVHRIQEERFRGEMARLNERGLESEGNIQWIDAEERLHPLGLKAIGMLCEEISAGPLAHPDKYLVGFQDIPREIPLLGAFEAEETKVSLRVPRRLRTEIEQGTKPHLARIVPPAAGQADGFAEGCHRYAAACTVPRKNRRLLISSLDRQVLKTK